MNYSYWENFISKWNTGNSNAINGWTDPDSIHLYGCGNNLSSRYIPEPWWGNDGNHVLHSVVINFNPGKGYQGQMKGIVPYKKSYANDVVNSGALSINDQWQWKNRAYPVLGALQRLGIKKGYPCLREHLSIELIPWRTPSINANYWNYLHLNIKKVYDNSICFAANESKRIANHKLNSVVILRMSADTTTKLLKELNIIGIQCCTGQVGTIGKGKYMNFQINNIPDVKFISIWGPTLRNNFPPQADLDNIINII